MRSGRDEKSSRASGRLATARDWDKIIREGERWGGMERLVSRYIHGGRGFGSGGDGGKERRGKGGVGEFNIIDWVLRGWILLELADMLKIYMIENLLLKTCNDHLFEVGLAFGDPLPAYNLFRVIAQEEEADSDC